MISLQFSFFQIELEIAIKVLWEIEMREELLQKLILKTVNANAVISDYDFIYNDDNARFCD